MSGIRSATANQRAISARSRRINRGERAGWQRCFTGSGVYRVGLGASMRWAGPERVVSPIPTLDP
jgi:hypothetical protein